MRHRTTIALALTTILLASTVAPAFAAEKVRQDPHLRVEAVYRGILPKRQATVDDTVEAIKARGFTRISVSGKGSRIRIGVSDYWKPFGKRTRFGVRYPVNALVIVKLVTPPKPPTPPATTDKQQFKNRLVYWSNKQHAPTWFVSKGMHVAWGESRYNADMRHGDYAGILSMDSRWGSVAQRQSIDFCARRFVKACIDGTAAKHWAATWN